MVEYIEIPQQNQPMSSEEYPPYQFPPQLMSPIKEMTLVTQTNPQSLIDEFEHKMKGEISKIDEKTGEKKWVKKFEPIMNDHGINDILVDIYAVFNQNTILSNLDESEVSKITIEFGKTLVLKLMSNWKDYGIKKSNLSTIILSATYLSFIALKRGFEEGERRFLKTAVRTSEQILIRPREGPSEDKKHFWEFWKS